MVIDGTSLSIPAVAAAARFGASVKLDDSPRLREQVRKSRQALVAKVDAETSVYGVSTGFGGSGKSLTFTVSIGLENGSIPIFGRGIFYFDSMPNIHWGAR